MPRLKRITLKQINVGIEPKLHLELSELAWATNRSISSIAHEMIKSDLKRFKDRHSEAIRDGKKSEQSSERSHSAGSEGMQNT